MRNLPRLTIAFAAALALATPAFAQSKINAGYVTATDFVPLLIAKEKGYFANHGLDVEPKRIPIITNIPPALISGDLQIGAPLVSGASVVAKVVAHGKHDKVRIFKMRRRKHYQKRQGHRQNFTEIQIGAVNA